MATTAFSRVPSFSPRTDNEVPMSERSRRDLSRSLSRQKAVSFQYEEGMPRPRRTPSFSAIARVHIFLMRLKSKVLQKQHKRRLKAESGAGSAGFSGDTTPITAKTKYTRGRSQRRLSVASITQFAGGIFSKASEALESPNIQGSQMKLGFTRQLAFGPWDDEEDAGGVRKLVNKGISWQTASMMVTVAFIVICCSLIIILWWKEKEIDEKLQVKYGWKNPNGANDISLSFLHYAISIFLLFAIF